jgi:hypothetical protein
VLQHAPNAVDARVRYAELLLQLRKHSQAHEAATVAAGLDPKNAAAYAVRSKAKEGMGDFKVGVVGSGGVLLWDCESQVHKGLWGSSTKGIVRVKYTRDCGGQVHKHCLMHTCGQGLAAAALF